MPKILIVEDDEVLACLIASVLAEAGYESHVAPSPEHAEGTYDLVVADYLAPAYEPGQPWPYLERLRALCQNGPILGCTGHQDALADPVASLGISAVTSKPFDVDELLSTIEQLLEHGRRVAAASPLAPHNGEIVAA